MENQNKFIQTKWSSDQATLEDLHKILGQAHFLSYMARSSINVPMLKQWHAKILTAWNSIISQKAAPNEKKNIHDIAVKFKKGGKLYKIVGQPGMQQYTLDKKKYYAYVDLISTLDNAIVQVANDHNMLLRDMKYETDDDEFWADDDDIE